MLCCSAGVCAMICWDVVFVAKSDGSVSLFGLSCGFVGFFLFCFFHESLLILMSVRGRVRRIKMPWTVPVCLIPSILLTNKCSCCAGFCPGENSGDSPCANGSLTIEEAVLEEQPQEQPQMELVKQEMLVQYLQDAYNFSVKITEALSLISKLMYENSVSGVWNSHGDFFPLFVVSRFVPFCWRGDTGVVEL